jgi:pimeloyl-ACP methyl ester carboxylesterase
MKFTAGIASVKFDFNGHGESEGEFSGMTVPNEIEDAKYIRTAFNLPIYETARKYTGPACIIHGTGDQVVPYTYGERYHYIWPGSELHILPAADHMFSKDMQKVVDLMVDFLVKTL